MKFVTITTAQALYAALGLSVFASILSVVLTLMAFVHITGRWADRGERTAMERDLYKDMCGKLALHASRLEALMDEKEGKV